MVCQYSLAGEKLQIKFQGAGKCRSPSGGVDFHQLAEGVRFRHLFALAAEAFHVKFHRLPDQPQHLS